MTRTPRLLSALALVAALAACSSGSDPDEDDPTTPGENAVELPRARVTVTAFGPTCASVFVDGVAMGEEAVEGCLDGPRGTVSPSTTQECADGRLLIVNQFGFGIVGSEVTLVEGRDVEPTEAPGYDEVRAECEG